MHDIKIQLGVYGTDSVRIDGMPIQATRVRLDWDAETGVPIVALSILAGSVAVDLSDARTEKVRECATP
jgi:hypothetical protein